MRSHAFFIILPKNNSNHEKIVDLPSELLVGKTVNIPCDRVVHVYMGSNSDHSTIIMDGGVAVEANGANLLTTDWRLGNDSANFASFTIDAGTAKLNWITNNEN